MISFDTKPNNSSKMVVVVNILIASVVVVILGAIFFQVLPRLFPKIREVLPSQSTVSYVQILPATFAFPALLWLFFGVFLHNHVERPFTSLQGWAHVVLVLFLWSNAVFNYYAAVFICPGFPQHQSEFLQTRNFVKTYEMCVKCKRVRDFGTHHCSWCHSCVEMMCHHCPFTNNCVGLRNYVYYYSLLVYFFFGFMYSMYITYFPFAKCMSTLAVQYMEDIFLKRPEMKPLHRYTSGKAFGNLDDFKSKDCEGLAEYAVLFAPASTIWFFIAFLLTYHSFLLLADMSIVDFFDTISRARSVKELFRILSVSILKRKKSRFMCLVYNQKSRWWKFFVPSFIDVHNRMPLKDL